MVGAGLRATLRALDAGVGAYGFALEKKLDSAKQLLLRCCVSYCIGFAEVALILQAIFAFLVYL